MYRQNNLSTSIVITKNGIPLRCQRCKHEWLYGGKNEWAACCPHCRTYVSIIKNAIRSEPMLGGETHPISRAKGIVISNG